MRKRHRGMRERGRKEPQGYKGGREAASGYKGRRQGDDTGV